MREPIPPRRNSDRLRQRSSRRTASRMLRRLLMMAVVPLSLVGLSQDGPPRWRTEPEPLPMPTPLRSGFAPVNGIAMFYAIYGSGPPILLIHGGLSNADV